MDSAKRSKRIGRTSEIFKCRPSGFVCEGASLKRSESETERVWNRESECRCAQIGLFSLILWKLNPNQRGKPKGFGNFFPSQIESERYSGEATIIPFLFKRINFLLSRFSCNKRPPRRASFDHPKAFYKTGFLSRKISRSHSAAKRTTAVYRINKFVSAFEF